MNESYEVVISKHGRFISMALVETLKEANRIKNDLLDGPFSGKYIIIEKTETTVISTTPFIGIDLTD